MKLVELTRDLRPWCAGDSALVPDAVADAMVKVGEAQSARTFPLQPEADKITVDRLRSAFQPRKRA